MTLSSTDVNLVYELSKFFRKNEKEILCGRKKLSLTSSVLCTLNRTFVSASHYGDNSCDLMKSILFLKNIVNNAIALKILNNAETVQGGIDLSTFHKLWMLELKKIPIHLLLGIDQLQKRLEILICSGSVFYLEAFSVNGTCSGWVALRHLDLSHNYLEKIDDCIKLFPNLETLNVSHNKLKATNGLQHLHKLNALNLGYNLLESLPAFHHDVFDFLKKLCLRNNKIEDLYGLEYLRNLESLDLSYNCLSEPLVFRPLNKLPYLKELKLVGNPVVLYPQYKIITVNNLHLNVCTVGLCLDNHQLSKKEMFNIRKIRDISSGLANSGPIQINVAEEDKDLSGDLDGPSVVCNITFTKENNAKDDRSISEIIENSVPRSTSPELKRKENNTEESSNLNEIAKSQYSKESTEKEKLEHSNCEVIIEDNSDKSVTILEMAARSSDNKNPEIAPKLDIDAICEDNAKVVLIEQQVSENVSNDNIEVISSETVHDEIREDSKENDGMDVYASDKADQDEGIESDIFLLEKETEGNRTPVFVSIGKHHLKERDILTSSVLDSLDLRVLESVKKPDEKMLCLKFNMLNKNRRERIYHAENEEITEELFKILQRHVDECNLKNILENALMCLKCEARFSRNRASQQIVRNASSDDLPSSYDSSKGNLKQVDCCPNCGSLMIFKDNNCPVDTVKSSKDSSYLLKPEDSQQESNSSNLKSLFLSSKNSPRSSRKETLSATKKKDRKVRSSSFDYSNAGDDRLQQQTTRSYDCMDNISVKSDNSGDILPGELRQTDFKRSSSDITVLSNPSQNGITLVSGNEFDQSVELNSPLDDGTFCNLLTSSVRMNAEYADENKNDSQLFQVNSSSDSEASSVCTALENYNSGSSSNACGNSFLRKSERTINDEENNFESGTNANLQYKQNELIHNIKNEDKEDNANASFETTESKDSACKQIIDNLININHALKLHLELKVFDMEEEFKVAAEVFVVSHHTMTTITGLLVLSSKKIYFLKLGENFMDNPENSVSVFEKKNLNQLNSVNVLLGNQGFTLSWGVEKCHTCLFKDADHCNCFVTYFTDFVEESKCACPTFRTSAETNLKQVVREVFLAEIDGKKYPSEDVDTEVLLFLLIESCSLEKDTSHPIAIVASSTEICLTQILFAKWTKSTKSFCPVERYRLVAKQKIINIVSLHLCLDTCKIGFHFLDEDTNKQFCWLVRTKTRPTLYSLFNTVKELWEKQFGIELVCTEDCKYNSETT